MVVLGEHPPVEVGRDVVSHVHLGQVAEVGHLVFGDADALLERDGVVVLARVDLLGDAGVGAVGADDLFKLVGEGGRERSERKKVRARFLCVEFQLGRALSKTNEKERMLPLTMSTSIELGLPTLPSPAA